MRRVGVGALLLAAGLFVSAVELPAAAAFADAVTPPGACTASGQWDHPVQFAPSSKDHAPGDVVRIPQKGTVEWQGHEMGKPIGYLGPPRPIDGRIQVTLPFGVTATVWHWGGDTSPRYSNEGQEKYDVPSALVGVKLKLSGYEKDSGKTVCAGSVFVEVSGNKIKNPVGWVALGGSVIFLAGMLAAGFRKTRPAYDDRNP
jgi:hypothetical protein